MWPFCLSSTRPPPPHSHSIQCVEVSVWVSGGPGGDLWPFSCFLNVGVEVSLGPWGSSVAGQQAPELVTPARDLHGLGSGKTLAAPYSLIWVLQRQDAQSRERSDRAWAQCCT